MREYFFRRLLILFPTIIFATLIVFFIIRLTPGHIIDLMITQHDVAAEEITREKIEAALGLDVPIYIQYFRWMKNIFIHGDLGNSLWKGTSVMEEVLERLPVTFELGLFSLFFALILAFPVGIYSAIRQDTVGDYAGRTIAILGIAVPTFVTGTVVIVVPGIFWGWSPPVEYVAFTENPVENLKMFLFPSLILGMALSAVTMRMTRTMMLEVLRQDYVRTAWAKGLKELTVVRKHALKNALIPVITLIGLQLPVLIGGTVIIESIFVLPGMGLLMLEAINQRDYPIITGLMLFIGLVILVINLVVDLSYGFLDPKVRYK
ncbi:MAG: ABC transporter permease [Deltaproteobacteria bacterium]|nr:ABC transporter permease [Deltaproteobacteria bacterium]MBW2051876.1 ABC transporter permease [Deltaproteobacteria bacterium]MBW2141231.1 ABC transporter permease [Deltaproteobacteria bacterium]MBW2323613.1 ABC transporter permease [Deltaproteobacteria bacterium]